MHHVNLNYQLLCFIFSFLRSLIPPPCIDLRDGMLLSSSFLLKFNVRLLIFSRLLLLEKLHVELKGSTTLLDTMEPDNFNVFYLFNEA